MSAKNAIIRICNGSKAWNADRRRIDILKHIDLSIYAGESIAITGPSGAGKSTLLHVLGLLTPLDEGELWFDGIRINSRDRLWDQRFRHQIGFVFQDAKLIAELTVLENVCLPLLHRGIWPSKQKKMAGRELERVGLAQRMTHRVNQLSGGELMRVALARAMVQNPRILLADEPTGNLDSATGQRIIGLLLSLVSVDRALIMATHNPELARKSNRQIHVKDGRIEPYAA